MTKTIKQILKKIPLLGKFLKSIKAFLELPNLYIRIDALETILQEKEKILIEKEKTQKKLDLFYLSFEDKFRGEREGIKERQKYYLPIVQKIIKNENQTLLDVGCGRGEWLELLKENNINAKGLDLNKVMVQTAQEFGLDVSYDDAISYLKKQKDATLDVITAFHIVEHLPFHILLELFDESYRVLKKGGIIIYETPNPENIWVGTCSFYTDPTHINPIPPVSLEFIANDRGFSNVEIHRLNPLKEVTLLEETEDNLNDLIYASTKAQDYSVIGMKL